MKADNAFVQQYMGLVRTIAQKVRAQMDLTCDLDDLIAFGTQGLIEAASRFDETRGVQFNTFAYYRIRGAVIDGVRQMAYLPRRIHQRVRAAEAIDQITQMAGDTRAASPEQGKDAAAAAAALDETLSQLTAAFVMASVGQGEDDAPESPEDSLMDAQTRARVTRALDVLPDRERALVQGFYFDGRTFDDVAKGLGVSKSWASRLHSKALELLREALEED
ncbi:MAG: sigma-70 family RNA polymerase sigma factor [Sandaracinaceae bacterium]|nr:sigma-70 family RNA polymerase sigma factor [Sandaracinaceae bacterium]